MSPRQMTMRASTRRDWERYSRGARHKTTVDAAASLFALTVFAGMQTFIGLVKEAYPVKLMQEGATLNESGWRRLHCAAVETRAADVVRAIDELKPVDASLLPCPE